MTRSRPIATLLIAVFALVGTVEAGPPSIRFDSISPATGPQTGGTTVTIKGDRLRGTKNVTIGGVALKNLVVSGDDTITGETGPSTTAGAADLVIVGKKQTLTQKGAFTYGTPQPPTTIALVSGNNQTGPAGTALPTPFVVVVKDAAGSGVTGFNVVFAVTAGGGTLSATTVATNAQGQASTTLRLGAAPGANTVTASGTGLTAVTFGATGTAGAAASVALASGNNQSGTAGQALAAPFVVTVRDANQNAVSGVSVTFAVTAGAGTLSATSVATNAQGQASATLTLGPAAGATNMATATAAGLAGSPVTFTAVAQAAVISFATDVKPILESKCTICHTQNGPASFTPFTDTQGGPATYAKVRNGTSFFQAGTPLVIPGDLSSILVAKTGAAGSMYVNLGANDTERAANAKKISDWVKAGGAP
ncbi:MAG: Ig-like domain-containing protein [Planctomycetota bacterium]